MNMDAKQLTLSTMGCLRSEAIEALVRDGYPETVLVLAKAFTRIDVQVRCTVVESLRQVADQRFVDSAWAIWATTRHAGLAALLTECGWVASAPKELKVFSALKAGRLEVVTPGGVEVVTPLLQACEDADSTIAEQARLALQQLKNVEAQETLCRLVIQHDHPLAREIAVATQYAPRDKVQRALFYFLTEQWDRYENLDFDQSLLKAAYEVADRDLLRRLAERARRAGRGEWVEVVAGGRQGRRLGDMTDGEWEAVLAVLVRDRRWGSMWRLAQVAPPVWSVWLLRRLKGAGWVPQEAERAGFAELVRLVGRCTGNVPELGRLVRHRAMLEGHMGRVSCLTISPSGLMLASGSRDYTVRLWSLPDGTALKTLEGHTGWIECLDIAPDERLLASGGGYKDHTVRLWSLPDGTALKMLKGHTYPVLCLAISPDGRLLASGSGDNTVRLWSLPDGTALKTLKGHTGRIECLAISPDGRLLTSGGGHKDHTVRLWSLPDGTALKMLKGHTYPVLCLAISPAGQMLASGSQDNTVRLWSLPDGTALKTLEGHIDSVNCLAISPDGRGLASGGGHKDHTVRLWRLPDGTALKTLEGHIDSINCLTISPDGRLLASGSWDNTVRLWTSDLARLSCLPVGQTTLEDMESVQEALQYEVPDAELGWLKFILALMHWRRRFDIEVEEMPRRIAVGEFDIEIGE